MITVLDIAWAAGIYEGEGSCRPGLIDRNGIAATVTQKDAWLTDRLRVLFGGSIGRAESEIHGTRGTYNVWRIYGSRARGFLMTIYPFLSPRRKRQVKVALLRTWNSPPRAPAGFCLRGHDRSPANDYVDPQGRRSCRRCKRELARTPSAHRFSNRRPTFPDFAAVDVSERSTYLEPDVGGITPLQIAWAAGIYEGEGSCSPNATNAARIGARVIQNDRWILERLQTLFGGSIGRHVTILYGRRHEGSVWHVSGARARGFLMTIYPFLSPWRGDGARTALLRTRRPLATAEFCRRGHPVQIHAALHRRGGRYCRACKNEKARQKYRSDDNYRRDFLDRMYAQRSARVGPAAATMPKRLRRECLRGHAFTTENTIVNAYRGRQCRACWNEGQRRRYHARKAGGARR